jgi:hypothetical protein
MAVIFTHSTSMHESCDFKTAKEIIDFALHLTPATKTIAVQAIKNIICGFVSGMLAATYR